MTRAWTRPQSVSGAGRSGQSVARLATRDDALGCFDEHRGLALHKLPQLDVGHLVECDEASPHSLIVELNRLKAAIRVLARHASRVPGRQTDAPGPAPAVGRSAKSLGLELVATRAIREIAAAGAERAKQREGRLGVASVAAVGGNQRTPRLRLCPGRRLGENLFLCSHVRNISAVQGASLPGT